MENKITNKRNSKEMVYNFIVEFIRENGYSPSVREICQGTNLSSTSSVYACLLKLKDDGKIEIKEKATRTIKVVGFEFVEVNKSV